MDRNRKFVIALLDRLQQYGKADGASLCRLFEIAQQPPIAEIAAQQDAMFDFPYEEAFNLAEKALAPAAPSRQMP